MKHLLILIAFLVSGLGGLRAQTLSFSDVILLNRGVTDTVPAGKVWKIESYTVRQEICGGYASSPITVQINGNLHYLDFSLKDGNGYIYNSNSKLPLWLPAGTIIQPVNAGGCLQAMSIIEFTVVP